VADDSKHVGIDMTHHKGTNCVKMKHVTFQLQELIAEVQPIDVSMQVQRQVTGLSANKTDFVWSI